MSPPPASPSSIDVPGQSPHCKEHDEEIDSLRSGHLELIQRIGKPPDASLGLAGSGLAGTLVAMQKTMSELQADVAKLRQELAELRKELILRRSTPERVLKFGGLVVAIAAPLAIAMWWIFQHVRLVP